MTIAFIIEWDGDNGEKLIEILEKRTMHSLPASGSLGSYVTMTKKKVNIIEVIQLWMGASGVPDVIKSSPPFGALLSVLTVMLLAPWQVRLLPDSAGEIIDLFEMKGFSRVLAKDRLYAHFDDPALVEEGVKFLIDRNLVEVEGNDLRLLETPLTNVKITMP